MKSNTIKNFCMMLFLAVIASVMSLNAQEPGKEQENRYQIKNIKMVKTTPVISQASTSTCWCFATTSMLESEILRLGGPETDLSEMFTVRNMYQDKAERYVRLQGNTSFPPGGAQHDVTACVKKYGAMPQNLYSGLEYGEDAHKHGEVHAVLSGIVENLIKNRNGKLTPVWDNAFSSVLDAYFGEIPEDFEYNGKKYSPVSFAASLPINPDDYIEFSSYTHHPFYEKFVLEVPDNWMHKSMYNVPIDELMEIIRYALDKGISISWAADISGLNFNTGVATIPEEGENVNDPGHKEKIVSQDDRQELFDNYQLTDDHAMHLVGMGEDQNGKKYFMEKNSWGDGNIYKGFSYMSESFMRLRTMSIMVHKDGVPKDIMKKL